MWIFHHLFYELEKFRVILSEKFQMAEEIIVTEGP